jgi:hypothetical protein
MERAKQIQRLATIDKEKGEIEQHMITNKNNVSVNTEHAHIAPKETGEGEGGKYV